jgi:hypothetical protein
MNEGYCSYELRVMSGVLASKLSHLVAVYGDVSDK